MHIVPNVYNVRIGTLVFVSMALRLKKYSVVCTVEALPLLKIFSFLYLYLYVIGDHAWITGFE